MTLHRSACYGGYSSPAVHGTFHTQCLKYCLICFSFFRKNNRKCCLISLFFPRQNNRKCWTLSRQELTRPNRKHQVRRPAICTFFFGLLLIHFLFLFIIAKQRFFHIYLLLLNREFFIFIVSIKRIY